MSAAPPAVSVIVPVYNREKYIADTIRSVLDQTFQDFEIIAVDDGSTDGSRQVLETFSDRVRILEHPGRVNRGQSAAINVALQQARGRYVGILDSDDLWLPRKLELQVGYLEGHHDVGLVYGNGWVVDEAGRRDYRIYDESHVETSDPRRVLLDCYFLLPNNALVRKEALERAGEFDESLRAAQDHDMAIRVAEVTRLAYLPDDIFCYRRHPDSISHKRADVRWRNGFRILAKAQARYDYEPAVIRKRRAVLHFRLGQCQLEQGQYLAAARNFFQALWNDPGRSAQVILGRHPMSSPH